MIDALTGLYGAPTGLSRASRAAALTPLDTAAVIAEWRQEDTHMRLRRGRYNEAFSLVITSVPLDAVARKAQATRAGDGRQRSAGARSGALEDSERTSSGQLEEQTRTANKKVFTP